MANKNISNPATRAVMKVVGEFEATLRKTPKRNQTPFMKEAPSIGPDPMKEFLKQRQIRLDKMRS
jgi:hypothetical protein